MHEGPRQFGGIGDELAQDEPFDYFENARQLREEREALEEAKKAEREAKRAEEKAEKDARVAKKMADKAADKLKDKSTKVSETSEKAKEEISEAKKEVEEIKEDIEKASDTESPVLEMAFGEGSVYTAELKDGEEAIFDLNHTIEKVEDKVELADEVMQQAEALAQARAAIESVDATNLGLSESTHEDNLVVYGESGPQNDVRTRLRQAWELPSVAPSDELEAYEPTELASTSTSSTDYFPMAESPSGSYAAASSAYANSYRTADTAPTTETELPAPSKTSSGLWNGAAFVGGMFAGRATTIKNRLENASSVLSTETADLKREVGNMQAAPIARPEAELPPVATRAPERSVVPSPEIRGTNEPAIPAWIRQVESDIKKNKVPELKKWQLDVLRAQHPDLVKKYEKLDTQAKETIKRQSKEYIPGSSSLLGQTDTSATPGDLPAPAYALPAYMKPADIAASPKSPLPAYDYSTGSANTNGSAFSNEYLTIVTVGGLLFGAALIAAFGF